MATTLDTIRGALRKGGLGGPALADIVGAATKLASAAAERMRTAALALDPLASAAERAKHREGAATARLEAEDADAVLAEAQRQHANALAADVEQERSSVYAAAKARADEAAAALRKNYPRVCRDALALIRQLAEAQAAVNAVNAALPAGAPPLADPEATVRGAPAIGREVISDAVVEKWTRLDMGQPVDDAYAGEIYEAGGPGWGKRPDDLEPCFLKARFRRFEYRDEVPAAAFLPLASYLRLPAVTGDGVLFGHHVAFGFDPALAAMMIGEDAPERVAERLATVDVTGPKGFDQAQRTKVEWTMLGYVGAVPLETIEPGAYHARTTEPGGRADRFGTSPFARPGRAAGGRR